MMKGMAELQTGHSDFVLKPRSTDYIKGVSSPIVFKAVNPSGNWTPRIEFFENQDLTSWGDTNGCVLFAAQESFDAQMDQLIASGSVPSDMVAQFTGMGYMDTGLDGNQHFHSSPRFLQVLTGNGLNGNSAPEPWDVMRQYGVLPWNDLPYDAAITEAEYFAPIAPDALAKAAQFLTLIGGENTIQYHWIALDAPKNMAELATATQQAPLCIGISVEIPGWNQVTPIDPPATQTPQHSVLIYEVQGSDSLILDHYSPYEKVLDAGYPIQFVLQGIVTIIAPIEQEIVDTASEIASETAQSTTVPTQTKQEIFAELKVVLQKLEQLL